MRQSDSQAVLVTGGTGFVGSHLVELLLEKGYRVTCLVRDTSSLRWLSGLDVELVKGDCAEPATLADAVRKVSVVFHLAGLTKARWSREYYQVNHLGTKNVLEACTRHNPAIQKFILVSSLAAAGPSPDGAPRTEADTPMPVSDYGRSKLLAEEEALRYKDRFPVLILRPSAVYGPRDSDMFELFRWAKKGITLELGGGERFISPCYVGDLATAMLLGAEKQTLSGSIYFVAEDRSYSWSEFRHALLSTGGVTARNIKLPYALAYAIGLFSEIGGLFMSRPAITNRQKIREASQKYWVCSLEKIKKDIAFSSEYSLNRGLELTWKWYREKGWL